MIRFRERLTPGAGTVAALLLVLPAVYLVVLPLDTPAFVPVAVAVVATAAAEGLLFGLAPVVEVRDGMLRAGPARIPVAQTGATAAFRRDAATAARGVDLDARAWLLLRGWIDPVLRIAITDPADPAPYWLVSTRRPEELAGAIAAERAALPVER